MAEAGATAPQTGRLIIGIGNRDRGDDAVGRIVAERLRACRLAGIEILDESGEAANLLGRFESAETIYVVDAAASGAPPGTIRRFDVASAALPQKISAVSTHGFGLAEAIEIARALKRLPRRCIVYTVEIQACDPGAPLTSAVAAAVDEVIARICAELACLTE